MCYFMTHENSLMAGAWNMVLLRCIGGLVLTVFILFLSIRVRNYALTLLITELVTLLPYLAPDIELGSTFTLALGISMPLDFF